METDIYGIVRCDCGGSAIKVDDDYGTGILICQRCNNRIDDDFGGEDGSINR